MHKRPFPPPRKRKSVSAVDRISLLAPLTPRTAAVHESTLSSPRDNIQDNQSDSILTSKTSGNESYGYTQTVFGSFKEGMDLRERAQALLKQRRISAPPPLEEIPDEESDDEPAPRRKTRWGAIASTFGWAFEKFANINILLVYLFIVAVATGMLCALLDILVWYLNNGRLYFFLLKFFDDRPWLSLPLWIAYTCGFIGLSLYFTHSISPTAAGSGIPEMKSILSGVTLNKYLSSETFFAKFLGLVCIMSSGLIVGRGGPFVHIASILANQLAKLRLFSKIEKNASLKNHMLGVACGIGMAGSHGATVGGVLFSIEVTSTYFSLRNYWYSFVSAFVAGITYRVGWNSFMGRTIFQPLFPTHFRSTADPTSMDWFMFVLIGILCGVLSVMYVGVNEAIIRFRRTYAAKYKILGPFPYAIMVGVVTAIVTFPGFFGTFLSIGNVSTIMDLIQDRPLNGYGFLSGDWGQYSKYFSLSILVGVRFVLQTIVLSVPAPMGVAAPLMALGGAFGRLVGEIINDTMPGDVVSPAAYAISGAAAIVGGVTQTLSSSVLMFEVTGDLDHSLGVLLTVIISVGISRRWSVSIFDSIQKIRGLPFMPDLTEEFYSLKAKNVMEKEVHCLTLRVSVDDLNQLLEKYVSGSKHGVQDYSIPILDSAETKVVVGATNVNSLLRLVEVLEWEVQRQKQVHDLQLSGIANPEQRRRAQQKRLAKLRSKKYDLRSRLGSIMLKAPITFDPDTSIEQIHVLFLTLRLKNAFVVKRGKIKGTITQKNLAKALKHK